MKSKSFELPKNSTEKSLQNKTFDFLQYYTPTAESNAKLAEKHKPEDGGSGENTPKKKLHVSKRERSPSKKKKKSKEDSMNISKINVDGGNVPHSSGDLNDSKVTSTPNVKGKKDVNENVKSIMKNASLVDNSIDVPTVSLSKNKPKKRNKSVSFMLDESEAVAIKRSKSELSIVDNKNLQSSKTKFIKNKKQKKKSQDGKENKAEVNSLTVENDAPDNVKKDASKDKSMSDAQNSEAMDATNTEQENKNKADKKKKRKPKKPKQAENPTPDAETENDAETADNKEKKRKKKKHHAKQAKDKTDTEGEPAVKSSKKDIKPEVIAQDLENLSIGDNAHTLTNLLDEMTVVDKKKKNKHKAKKNKQQVKTNETSTDASEPKSEEKEKVKWMKRKWNKDRKGAVNDDKLATTIIIENLPLKIMCNYKKLLTDHFAQFGAIKLIGLAEVYSIEHPETFTTTINFDTEDAANKAIEEDNTLFEGSRIRVKRPLPPSQTTLVVRSYADLSEPALSSVFTSAGRIRNVRKLVKGKKSMCTAFIEFDGPDAVERAIKMAEDVKIGGKKIFAAKFELRNKNKKVKTNEVNEKNENNAGSDESSD